MCDFFFVVNEGGKDRRVGEGGNSKEGYIKVSDSVERVVYFCWIRGLSLSTKPSNNEL